MGSLLLAFVIWFVNVPNIRAAGDIIAAITPTSDVNTNIAAFKQAYADGSFGNQEITEQLLSFAETEVQDSNISNADKQTLFTYAIQQGQALVAAIPMDARIRLELALALRAGGDYPDALKQSSVAGELSPTKQTILIEEGVEEWQNGDAKDAGADFTKAYELDTSFTTAAAYAAGGDIINGNLAEGKALLQQTFGTTTVDQDPVLLSYYQAKDFPDLLDVSQLRIVDDGYSAAAEFAYAAALADAGDTAAARAEIQAAITAHPDAASEGAAMLAQLGGGSTSQ